VDPVDGTLAQGELDVQVQSSSYNVTPLRDAMIQAAALTAQNSANGSNCYDATYVVPGKRKRWGLAPLSSLPRRWLFLGYSERGAPGITDAENGLFRRNMIMPENIPEKMQLCNAAGFAGVQYYSPFWRDAENPGSTDWIDAEWKFKVGMDGLLQCEFIAGLVEALGAIQPEFEAPAAALAEGIQVVCQNAMDHV